MKESKSKNRTKRLKGRTIKQNRPESLVKDLKKDWQLYLLLIIPIVLVIVFNYASYPGLRMIFYDYKPARGWDGSKFVGFKIIEKVFHDKKFLHSLSITIIFNLLDLLLSFPMPIILALMLNELRLKHFKKVSQTILYLPHFLSWVVIGSVAYAMFRPNTGLVNMALMKMGLISEGIPFLTEKWHWAWSYLLINVWQTMGWGTIIYLAAITSINGELYEAAMLDGAGRWQQMIHVTLPGIKSTIVTLLIMNLGKIMNSNFERLDSLQNTQVRDFSYQLAMYIYENGLQGAKFSQATVVGLFQSIVGLIMVIAADRIAKMLGEEGLL